MDYQIKISSPYVGQSFYCVRPIGKFLPLTYKIFVYRVVSVQDDIYPLKWDNAVYMDMDTRELLFNDEINEQLYTTEQQAWDSLKENPKKVK